MSDSRFTEFVSVFNDRVRVARLGEPDAEGVTPLEPREIAFTTVFLEDMEDIGLIADSDIAHFEKKLGRANGKLNGFAISEDGAQLTLITTISASESGDELGRVPSGEIIKATRAAVHVYRSAKDPIHEKMEDSGEQRDLMQRLHDLYGSIGSIRVTVLINGLASNLQEFEQPDDDPEVTIEVWDLERLFRAASSERAYESVSIDLEEMLGKPLPCLTGPQTAGDHRCYFAVIPGDLLHALYHEHGPRLLELNVRSFLQARGKVNKGIRDTLHEQPRYFLAYNNGISATVESLEIVKVADGGTAISKITGLQIVNGGQTMASIHRAKDRDKVDLSDVFVQAKITRIEEEAVDDLVPMISRYSNTQNKVNETDFSANHPFHVAFQKLSERVWAPGETSRWFYERARGQWEVARIRESNGGTSKAKLKAFDLRTPRTQKIDKNQLAKVMNSWDELPHVVSLGGQKCFIAFMKELGKRGAKWEPDEDYYRRAVARIIIFKRAEKIARQIGFSAYRANAVCYTVAMLAFRTAGRLDLDSIWMNQDVSEALEETMRAWMPRIHEEIVDSAEGRNVTEWCKKKECWALVQSLNLEFAAGLEEELAEGQPTPNVGQHKVRDGVKPKALTQEERERQAKVMKLSPDEWQELIAWMVTKPSYAGFPIQICGTILGYAAAGWKQVPSPKQTKHLVKYISAWNESRDEGEDE
jgi:hypothetical protein